MPSPSRLPPGQLPVRHIDPDDLPDDEWDRLAAGPTPRSVAWRIGSHIEDAWRAIWQVDAARLTAHDFALYLGRPLAMSGPGGAAVILTAELVAYLERFRRAPDLIDLPLSRTTVKRLRRALGHNWYEDGERWWLRRMDDLEAMTTADFAVRYGVKLEAVTYARLNLLGPRQRPAHWWLEPATADLLLSPQPRIYIALMLAGARMPPGARADMLDLEPPELGQDHLALGRQRLADNRELGAQHLAHRRFCFRPRQTPRHPVDQILEIHDLSSSAIADIGPRASPSGGHGSSSGPSAT